MGATHISCEKEGKEERRAVDWSLEIVEGKHICARYSAQQLADRVFFVLDECTGWGGKSQSYVNRCSTIC